MCMGKTGAFITTPILVVCGCLYNYFVAVTFTSKVTTFDQTDLR